MKFSLQFCDYVNPLHRDLLGSSRTLDDNNGSNNPIKSKDQDKLQSASFSAGQFDDAESEDENNDGYESLRPANLWKGSFHGSPHGIRVTAAAAWLGAPHCLHHYEQRHSSSHPRPHHNIFGSQTPVVNDSAASSMVKKTPPPTTFGSGHAVSSSAHPLQWLATAACEQRSNLLGSARSVSTTSSSASSSADTSCTSILANGASNCQKPKRVSISPGHTGKLLVEEADDSIPPRLDSNDFSSTTKPPHNFTAFGNSNIPQDKPTLIERSMPADDIFPSSSYTDVMATSQANKQTRRCFEERYRELQVFHKRFGHCDVLTTGEYRGLGRWVSNLRCRHRTGLLPAYQAALLHELGSFGFEPNATANDARNEEESGKATETSLLDDQRMHIQKVSLSGGAPNSGNSSLSSTATADDSQAFTDSMSTKDVAMMPTTEPNPDDDKVENDPAKPVEGNTYASIDKWSSGPPRSHPSMPYPHPSAARMPFSNGGVNHWSSYPPRVTTISHPPGRAPLPPSVKGHHHNGHTVPRSTSTWTSSNGPAPIYDLNTRVLHTPHRHPHQHPGPPFHHRAPLNRRPMHSTEAIRAHAYQNHHQPQYNRMPGGGSTIKSSKGKENAGHHHPQVMTEATTKMVSIATKSEAPILAADAAKAAKKRGQYVGWHERLKQLMEYRKKNGHCDCRIMMHDDFDLKDLGRWLVSGSCFIVFCLAKFVLSSLVITLTHRHHPYEPNLFPYRRLRNATNIERASSAKTRPKFSAIWVSRYRRKRQYCPRCTCNGTVDGHAPLLEPWFYARTDDNSEHLRSSPKTSTPGMLNHMNKTMTLTTN